MRGSRTALIATAAVSALAVATTAPSWATAVPSEPIVSGLAGPLQLDVGSNGQIYTGQSFAGLLTKVRPNGTTKDLVAEPGEVAGVASNGYDVAYTFTGGDEEHPIALLKRRFANGTVRTVANLGAYEKKHNPDARNTYGFRNLSETCAAQVPAEVGGYPYTGLVDSHPYALASDGDGGWYVADAGGNDILHVTKSGRISVVIVIRPQKTTITADAAEAFGLPDCVIGKTYAFEPVPTDVEVTKLGFLMVSLLPGGPEDASLGARGAVMRVGGDGGFSVLARGFLGATNLAVGPGGRIYVSEMFANRISMLHNGVVTTVADVPTPAGLEYANGTLYAAVDVFANGSIVTITP